MSQKVEVRLGGESWWRHHFVRFCVTRFARLVVITNKQRDIMYIL